MKCSFAAGVSIYKTSESEVVASGNERTIILEGPAQLLLKFLDQFADGNALDIGEAIDNIVRSSGYTASDAREIVAGLNDVAERLMTTGILASQDASAVKARYKRAIFFAHHHSSGLTGLVDIFPAETTEICLLGPHENAFEKTMGIVKPATVDFPGWDRLADVIGPASESTIVVAIGLSNGELHKLNKFAVASRVKWIYAAFSGGRVVVSPVYRYRKTPCFACARLRRLGSVDDVVSGAILEANFMKDLPLHHAAESLERPVNMMLAGLIAGKADEDRSVSIHTVDKTTLEVSQIALTRLLDCPVCGGD